MTGVAEIVVCITRPHSNEAWINFQRMFRSRDARHRFVVLGWRRTGSNLLCGALHNHPEILMHNEIMNNIDIFTYHGGVFRGFSTSDSGLCWTPLSRDVNPKAFVQHVWSGLNASLEPGPRHDHKAVGFKSFPEHWRDSGNEDTFLKEILHDPGIQKIVLKREDELRVYVSMLRAEQTGRYMTANYDNEVVYIDPVAFQRFVDNYRDAYRRLYKSPYRRFDTFQITYEQMLDDEGHLFSQNILPKLWDFLGVANDVPWAPIENVRRQSSTDIPISAAITNYDELEFAFRHSDVKHFMSATKSPVPCPTSKDSSHQSPQPQLPEEVPSSWSILLPICSRQAPHPSAASCSECVANGGLNRFAVLEEMASSSLKSPDDMPRCWTRIKSFVQSLKYTLSDDAREKTEVVVGIDVDDPVFATTEAKAYLKALLLTAVGDVLFMDVLPHMYGKICWIWNKLAARASNDYIVLLGDDIVLDDKDWQTKVSARFHATAQEFNLPLGAAVVALNDVSFPGFPTFPVVHRWHMDHFGQVLPRQFVNQDGDPFLFDLYSRWNAASFIMDARLRNTVGGASDARYWKHSINWRGQVLQTQLKKLQKHLDCRPSGMCLDVVVPTFRCDCSVLEKIVALRISRPATVKFWIVVDNPDEELIARVQDMADAKNAHRDGLPLESDRGGYFVQVVSYGANRGASHARNVGLNYSTADWILFLDDDVLPEPHLLDAYAGAVIRHPHAKAFVGLTELPPPFNFWTEVLEASNITYFYGVAKNHVRPPWGVTANLLISGGRHHAKVQFKNVYPKTGGGEDLDFVFQLKAFYKAGAEAVVAVPGARATHPWWNGGQSCYRQIMGWAWGDSLCISEWPSKTYLTAPNWAELIFLLAAWQLASPALNATSMTWSCFTFCVVMIATVEHLMKAIMLLMAASNPRRAATTVGTDAPRCPDGMFPRSLTSLLAGTVVSAQEVVRLGALLRRGHMYSFSRRFDWFDGQAPAFTLDAQLRDVFKLLLHGACLRGSMLLFPIAEGTARQVFADLAALGGALWRQSCAAVFSSGGLPAAGDDGGDENPCSFGSSPTLLLAVALAVVLSPWAARPIVSRIARVAHLHAWSATGTGEAPRLTNAVLHRGVDSPDFESKSSSTTASNVMAAEGPWGVPLAAGLPSSSITNTGRRLHHGHGALSSSARAALSVMNHETLGLKQKRRMASGATPARPTSAGPHRHAAGAAAIRTRHHVSSALGRMLLWMGFAGLPAVMPSALGDSPP